MVNRKERLGLGLQLRLGLVGTGKSNNYCDCHITRGGRIHSNHCVTFLNILHHSKG